jgi:dihydrofolate reductase
LAKYAAEQLKTKDDLLLGRKTYQFFASYWLTSSSYKDNPILAPMLNDIEKIVFSRTLDRAEWNNSRLIKENMAEEVLKLKESSWSILLFWAGADRNSKDWMVDSR